MLPLQRSERWVKAQRYGPWFDVTYGRWLRNRDYSIFAYSPIGRRLEGTKFGEYIYKATENRGNETNFCWVHGPDLKGLHELVEEWIHDIVDHSKERTLEQNLKAVGLFYHSFVQYCPYKRGSAAIGNIFLAALFMEIKKQHPTFQLPITIENLDCYALSFQANDFLEKAFLPWCRGGNGKELFGSLLSTSISANSSATMAS